MNSLPGRPQPVKFFLLTTIILFVVIMAGISIAYALTPINRFTVGRNFLGLLGWTTLTASTIYISLKHRKECFFIFLLFFTFGFFSKAYLEPISDQLDHLCRTQEKCRNIDDGGRINRGLWQYNMNSLFICDGEKKVFCPEKKLFYLDILHGLYIAFASTILYTLSRNAGLPEKWSFLSVVIAVLFMGTDKFSYFRYYSYAPSFTSFCAYWVWVSAFFFSNDKKTIILGFLFFIPIAAVIAVNHIQELVFLTYIIFFWTIAILTEKILFFEKKTLSFLWILTIFLFFFFFPQLQLFENIFNLLPFSNLWEKNQNIVYHWKDIHVMGKIWISQYRVLSTIGLMGLASLILTPLMFLCNQGRFSKSVLARVTLLGVLPFLIFCTPLCHYIWAAHVQIPVYYRVAYSSLFWIPIAYFLYFIEICIKKYWDRRIGLNSWW